MESKDPRVRKQRAGTPLTRETPPHGVPLDDRGSLCWETADCVGASSKQQSSPSSCVEKQDVKEKEDVSVLSGGPGSLRGVLHQHPHQPDAVIVQYFFSVCHHHRRRVPVFTCSSCPPGDSSCSHPAAIAIAIAVRHLSRSRGCPGRSLHMVRGPAPFCWCCCYCCCC